MAADLRFRAMGSDAHVVVLGDPALVYVARRRIEDLERRWSRFLPRSEVSALNSARGRAMVVSPETFELVSRAVDAWILTGGRFDPTVLGDLVRAGYDRPFEAVVVRPGSGVSTLERDCGGIGLDSSASTVTLPANTGFDPGGIGKGLAADIVVRELRESGAAGVCVNLGGDVRVEGEGPADGRWIVAVERPGSTDTCALLALDAGAVATSTTTKRRWTVDGETRNHLIDPSTGRPLGGGVVSATAVAREAAFAEAATKSSLLAPAGWQLAAFGDLGCEGLLVNSDGSLQLSPGMRDFVIDLPDHDNEEVAS